MSFGPHRQARGIRPRSGRGPARGRSAVTSRRPARSDGVGYVMARRHRVGSDGLIPAEVGRDGLVVGGRLGRRWGAARRRRDRYQLVPLGRRLAVVHLERPGPGVGRAARSAERESLRGIRRAAGATSRRCSRRSQRRGAGCSEILSAIWSARSSRSTSGRSCARGYDGTSRTRHVGESRCDSRASVPVSHHGVNILIAVWRRPATDEVHDGTSPRCCELSSRVHG